MDERTPLRNLLVMIKGGGEMASGVAHRLFSSHLKVFLTEIPQPLCIRREVSFCEAIFQEEKEVEGITAKHIPSPQEVYATWEEGKIPLLIDPEGTSREVMRPHVIVDAILAKRNTGTYKGDAPLVIGLGPGFWAGKDVDVVVETNRGHYLGRVIYNGPAQPDTGVPGEIAGVSAQRVVRAPRDGTFRLAKRIGDMVKRGEVIAWVEGEPMRTAIEGVIRGLLREGTEVHKGLKAGDVDPRGVRENCYTISDKARAVGGSVLEAILAHFNL
ncbi:MAG: EF2563 family selenium-dependent molybdenum hydroxylase system protein [Deltaproteobacteria bacterium]|nr:EF2563 family selenium-dependent molybdenum hydroxylase system protein [Deltaproteobacteria bacterium]